MNERQAQKSEVDFIFFAGPDEEENNRLRAEIKDSLGKEKFKGFFKLNLNQFIADEQENAPVVEITGRFPLVGAPAIEKFLKAFP